MQAFLRSVAATTLDWTLYFVSDWRKVGAAEAYLSSLFAAFQSDNFVDQVIPFEPNARDQAQFLAASTSLRRLTNGWTTGARKGSPVEHPARYPEFVVLPYEYDTPQTYQVTIPVLKKDSAGKLVKDGSKTKVVTRNARAGLKIQLRASVIAEAIEAEANES